MFDLDEMSIISNNSIFSTGYSNNNNGFCDHLQNCQEHLICKEENGFGFSLILFSENNLFNIEKDNNFTKRLESNYFIQNNDINESSEQDKKIKFILEKENLEKIVNNNKNNVYRKDAYYKHFKAIFARYIKNKANRLKNTCFPRFNQNNFSALVYKYTGNPKEKDNNIFLSFTIKELLIFGKNEKTKNRQYNNELLIKYIEKNKYTAKDKLIYGELVDFLNNTVENELINFYRNKTEYENINKDPKCLFFDKYFKKETGISLLEKNGFIKVLKKPQLNSNK